MAKRSVLLLKVPHCTHPDAAEVDVDFRTKSTFRPVPSLGLAALCAFFDKYNRFGHRLKAVDVNIEAYTNPRQLIDVGVYQTLLENIIRENDYDVLALSAMFIFNARWVDEAARLSRRFHPEAKIIVGGGYPTIFPERSLKNHGIHFAILGEGEASFIQILNKISGELDEELEARYPLSGYAENKNGEITVIAKSKGMIPMEDIPVPAWQALDVEKYFRNSGDNVLPMEASRGCPYSCTFCSTFVSWGKAMRYKPIDQLIGEFHAMGERHDNPALHFIDDNLTVKRKWLVPFLNRIIDEKLPLQLHASNIMVKHLDAELIDLLVKAGMGSFGIAIESGSPEIQKEMNKNIDFDKARDVIGLMKNVGLPVHINWMVGFPNESFDQIRQTFDLARELKANSNQFLTVTPYPGTKMFKRAKEAGLLIFDEEDLDKFDNRKCDYLKSSDWDYDQLRDLIYDINIELNFLNNPSFDGESTRRHFKTHLAALLKKLSEHIIGHVTLGYLCHLLGEEAEVAAHYDRAVALFAKPDLNTTFNRYLHWNHPVISHFQDYMEEKDIHLMEPLEGASKSYLSNFWVSGDVAHAKPNSPGKSAAD